MDFVALRDLYRTTLLDDCVPFWMRHAIDANGGINTCIADDGQLHSRDRWNWSQWRGVYVFSKLYNCIEKRPEWLATARGIYDFVTTYGPLDDGHWPLLLDGDGQLKRGYESIYVDGFAIYGLTELWQATREQKILDQAMDTFRIVEPALANEAVLPAWPYTMPEGLIAQGVSMLFSLVYHELADATGDAAVRAASQYHHQRVMNTFMRPTHDLVVERMRADDSELDPPEGTAVIPGHAIESMWFQMHIARAADDKATLDKTVASIRRHLEAGWDREFGGLFLAIDAEGRKDVAWRYPDTKIWWPHTEALYATLLAYEHCREDWCLDWHERVREYSYAHFPVKEHGEWTQKLDRQGNVLTDVVALPVKDPFHLPRALIYCIEVLDRLISA